jgi:hypothetical protein
MTRRASLTDVWQGLYSYREGASPVHFVATLVSAGNGFGGMTHETVKGSRGEPLSVFASVDGNLAGSTVTFRKDYDGTGGWRHSVLYEGAINADRTEIEGRWVLPAGFSGRFLMIRSAGVSESALRAIYEKA